MLVVEGPNDESLLGSHCQQQIFAAGTRNLVEEMLLYERFSPIDGCLCVYLTDCDGVGEAIAHAEEAVQASPARRDQWGRTEDAPPGDEAPRADDVAPRSRRPSRRAPERFR